MDALERCKKGIELIAETLGLEGFSRIDAFVHVETGEVHSNISIQNQFSGSHGLSCAGAGYRGEHSSRNDSFHCINSTGEASAFIYYFFNPVID